jgi:hypothetical protein
MTFSYGPGEEPPVAATDTDVVRLLLNDIDENSAVFSDEEIQTFLDLEGGAVKLAAAQAIDTNADNEALASKVLRTQDLATDGAKIADALRKRAQALRDQHNAGLEEDGYFDVIPGDGECPAELAPWPSWY